jgi:hypothetical protein
MPNNDQCLSFFQRAGSCRDISGPSLCTSSEIEYNIDEGETGTGTGRDSSEDDWLEGLHCYQRDGDRKKRFN